MILSSLGAITNSVYRFYVHEVYTNVMPLTLYRRHTKACGASREYMDCDCTLWISGRTDTGIVPRQTTGTCDLKTAEKLRASLLADSQAPEVYGPRLSECAEKYLEARRHELVDATLGHYKLLFARLVKFCEAKGVYFAQELNVDLLETFKVEGMGDIADTTRSMVVGKLRCFLRDAFRRGWISEALAEKVRSYTAVYEQKEPYTPREQQLILDGALTLTRGTHGFARYPKTFRLLLQLMLNTGLRAGDAIRYDPGATFRSSQFWVYQFLPQKRRKDKAPRLLKTYLSLELKDAIDKCEWLSDKRPFVFQANLTTSYLTNEVQARMQTIGKRFGVPDCRPHRLRDTFAVNMLLRGLPLEEVSRLLGHSSVRTTELYYAKWIRAREDRLEGLLAKALMDTGSN